MRKQNLLSKKIGKQILSINNLLENYFNSLRRFILDLKKLRFDRNNKVFLVIVSIIFLTLVYFLIPTAYDKELIQKEIKNQIYQKYNIIVKFEIISPYKIIASLISCLDKVGSIIFMLGILSSTTIFP